jgi:hypothetical protein
MARYNYVLKVEKGKEPTSTTSISGTWGSYIEG